MRTVINTYNPDGVDETVLHETGRGGFLSDGYLRDEPLASYVGSDENVVFVRSNGKRGVSRESMDGGEGERFTPGDGYRAFAVLTDTRILFVVGDNSDGERRDRSITVPLADIELVEGDEGVLTSELVVTTRSDVAWRFPCTGDLADVVEYLDVASMTWMGVESHLETARKRVVDATQRCESREFDAATDALTAARAAVAAARREERTFVDDGVAAIETRVSRTEERIADATLQLHRSRGAHLLRRAERRWRTDEYRRAYDDFVAAHDEYVAALSLENDDLEATGYLREKLARVERNLQALERAPIERAGKACERAYEADDLRESANHLERALDRYRTALELDWGLEHQRFAGDTDALRERVDAVASELVETRRRLAARHVKRGTDYRENGRDDAARREFQEARGVLDETLETAEELVPDAVETIEEHRDAVDRRLDADDGGVARVYSD